MSFEILIEYAPYGVAVFLALVVAGLMLYMQRASAQRDENEAEFSQGLAGTQSAILNGADTMNPESTDAILLRAKKEYGVDSPYFHGVLAACTVWDELSLEVKDRLIHIRRAGLYSGAPR